MRNRAIGNWLLLFGGFCLLWSASSGELRAGQNYPSHVSVFGRSSTAPAAAQKIDPAKEADIRQLMDLLGTRDTVTRSFNSMESSMRPLFSRALPPGAYRERLVELFFEKFQTKISPQDLLNLAVPLYAQYLSDADIKGLIQFYKTPLGQKWISVQPKVGKTLLPEAHSMGREIGRQTMLEVLEEHPELAQELKAAEVAAHPH
ncbi:MAG TPA: DUF2059 domain-containing protein [Terriglobia bacterium]|nr:DUF2059 domain-containing protein [Terriglobia bacterium]